MLDGEGSNRLKEIVQHYPELKITTRNTKGHNLAEMMNEGLGLARGKYIQFLEPGDRYISQHGLEFLSTLVANNPHLVYANSLSRGAVSSSDFISTRSPWFLKSKLFELGGFDRRLSECPAMDLLCRLFQDRKTEAVYCRRVLIDTEMDPKVPVRESCKVLYRHFGFWHTLKWVFLQDRSQILRRTAAFVKAAFWKSDG